MTETRTSRANTPRARAGASQRPSQAPAARRASSVPAVGSRKAEYILDCVLMTPRKRKRTSLHEDLPPSSSTLQAQRSRRGSSVCSPQKKAPLRAARTRARSAEKEPTSTVRTRSRSRKRTSSPIPMPVPAKTPRRRAASRSRGTSDSAAGPSSSPLRRASSRVSTPQRSRAAPGSRIAGALAASRRNKGKGKATPVDFETSSQANPEEAMEAESSTSGARRPAKRRRLSPRLPPDTFESSTTATLTEEDVDYQQATLDDDFQMLDMPDDATLPWVPMNPESKEATYVPPGLNALIEDMKRALVLQISARQKAENMHAEELQRRRELEHEAARLAAANRALEAERSVWTTSAAEALASTLESALAADMSRRFAAETPPGVILEEVPQHPSAMATDPSSGASALIGGLVGTSGADTMDAVRDGEPEATGPSTLASTTQAAMHMQST
ncbi:hypothetical protein GY45DRAFT_908553 [Cubamyces sp. BRFM 1775]|nr:hypothetical protein GY45DRAFT_908553 [Cubamyces sp. BRFM 1775]